MGEFGSKIFQAPIMMMIFLFNKNNIIIKSQIHIKNVCKLNLISKNYYIIYIFS